ncbi:MAG: trehalose-phosphatase [Hyphomonadaceae bacterium]
MALESSEGLRRDQRMAPPPALDPKTYALFTDIDGTLVEIEQRPDLVEADADLRATLSALVQRMDGAIAALTGRRAEEANMVLGFALPFIAGLHGRELQRAGVSANVFDSASLDPAREALAARLMRDPLDILIEDKGAGIALHYRQAPALAGPVGDLAHAIAEAHGLEVLSGKMVVELLAPGASKGRALATLMQEAPFAGRTPIAIGDDVTDESAFAAADALGGFGILVGAVRETSSRFRLPSVASVRAWLEDGARA